MKHQKDHSTRDLFRSFASIQSLAANKPRTLTRINLIPSELAHGGKAESLRPAADVRGEPNLKWRPIRPSSKALARLRDLAKGANYHLAFSDLDFMRVALVSHYEYLQGIVLPWSVFPNSTQAYRALKSAINQG